MISADAYGKSFIEEVKALLGFKAKERDVMKGAEGYHLREETTPYTALSRFKKTIWALEKTYLWEINSK